MGNELIGKYLVSVKSATGTFLTFNVDEFKIDNNGFFCFTDKKTGHLRMFFKNNVEVESRE